MLIDALKTLARVVFVLDAKGNVVYLEPVLEVGSDPNDGAANAALEMVASKARKVDGTC